MGGGVHQFLGGVLSCFVSLLSFVCCCCCCLGGGVHQFGGGGGGASFPCATILRLIPECYRGAGSLISISCHSIADHCKDEGPLPLLEGSSHQFFLQVIILDREKHAVPMILRRNTHRGGAERVHKLISCNREVPQCGPCTFHDLPWSQPLGGQSCNKTVQPGIRGPFSSP